MSKWDDDPQFAGFALSPERGKVDPREASRRSKNGQRFNAMLGEVLRCNSIEEARRPKQSDMFDSAPEVAEWGNLRLSCVALVERAHEGSVAAIREIADRLDGKATQHVAVTDNAGVALTDTERAARIAQLLDLARARGVGAVSGSATVAGSPGPADGGVAH